MCCSRVRVVVGVVIGKAATIVSRCVVIALFGLLSARDPMEMQEMFAHLAMSTTRLGSPATVVGRHADLGSRVADALCRGDRG